MTERPGPPLRVRTGGDKKDDMPPPRGFLNVFGAHRSCLRRLGVYKAGGAHSGQYYGRKASQTGLLRGWHTLPWGVCCTVGQEAFG